MSETLGKRLRELCRQQGSSLRALAEESGLSAKTLSLIENGKTSPSVSTLQQISIALHIPITYYGGPNRGDGKIPIPHPVESQAVRLAFNLYATGEYSDGKLAEFLNSQDAVMPVCGSPLRGVSSKGHRYYRDAGQIEKRYECRQPLVKADDIENQVVTFLRNVMTNIHTEASVRGLQVAMDEMEARFERAKFLFLAGEMSKDRLDMNWNGKRPH